MQSHLYLRMKSALSFVQLRKKRYSRPTARFQDATHSATLTQITSANGSRPIRHRSKVKMRSVWLHTFGTHALESSLSTGGLQVANANGSVLGFSLHHFWLIWLNFANLELLLNAKEEALVWKGHFINDHFASLFWILSAYDDSDESVGITASVRANSRGVSQGWCLRVASSGDPHAP